MFKSGRANLHSLKDITITYRLATIEINSKNAETTTHAIEGNPFL
jgi:hypothetical protein